MKPHWSGFLKSFHDVLIRGQDPPITDAPFTYLQAAALAALSVAVSHKVTIPYAGRMIAPQLAAVLLGNAHEHRRSRAIYFGCQVVNELSQKVRRKLLGPDDFTAEALLDFMSKDVNNQNLLLTFNSDLQDFLTTTHAGSGRMKTIVRALLDEPNDYTIVRSGKEPVVIERPRLTILTSLNPAALPQLPKSQAEFATGLCARLLVVMPGDETGDQVGLDYLPPRVAVPSRVRGDQLETVAKLLHERGEACGPFEKLSQQAERFFKDWLDEHHQRAPLDVEVTGQFTTLHRYLPDHLIRLGGLYQVDLDPTCDEIGLAPMEVAAKFIEVTRKAIYRLGATDRPVAFTEYERALRDVVRVLHRTSLKGDTYAPLPAWELRRRVGWIRGKELDDILLDLAGREVVSVVKPNNRGSTVTLLLKPHQAAAIIGDGTIVTPTAVLLGSGSDADAVTAVKHPKAIGGITRRSAGDPGAGDEADLADIARLYTEEARGTDNEGQTGA